MPADVDHREARLRLIRTLLERRRIPSQAVLVSLLEESGYDVTQSSVSRDLRDLGATKFEGAYRMAVPQTMATPVEAARASTFALMLGWTPAGDHLLVVRTPAGAAQIVTAAIDALALSEVVGTLAGDDTFFIATASRVNQRRVVQTLERLQRGGQP